MDQDWFDRVTEIVEGITDEEGRELIRAVQGKIGSGGSTITIIEGDDLDNLLAAMDTGAADIYRLRVWQSPDGGAVKIKVNERMWTAPLGRRDGA